MNKSLGERIKSIRLEKGYTMEDFGKLFKTSKGTVNNWEKGRNNPNRENLKKIAEIGSITVEELLYGDKRDFINPLIVSVVSEYYGFDISEDSDTINHIFNRLESYSYDDTVESLAINNKDIFDNIILYPWDWDSSGFIHYASTKVFEITNELEQIYEVQKQSFSEEMQTDIKQTVETIQEMLFYAKEKIESIKVNEKFISDPETFLEEMKSEANQIQIDFDEDTDQ